MEADRWRRIEALFHEVSERSPEERAPYLLAACDDDEVRHEVEALLAASDGADQQLDQAVAGALELAAHEPPPEWIGPYRVLKPLGDGGLATVYLAERSEPHMQVAIKVVKRGMDTAEILRRLRLESRILARLDHPNIARLIDGGSTEDGRPYVVMEAIEGEPIDRHCDRRRLDLRQRLELFRKVCSAVHAAHRSLIIHRDLKPTNILVTEDGEPKLLDFGIAKLLGPAPVDHTEIHTVTGMRWMTPEFASPEQVRGEPLTTAADVYALGVLLYELLCGLRPFRFEARSQREVERLVCDSEPAAPSARLLETAAEEPSLAKIAEARRESPERLRKRLTGDLDTIAGVAMHKEAERRYPSVQALEDDIRRYLESRPLTARPDSTAYRLRKFVRRNRTPVSAAVLVVLSLLVGLGSTYRALQIADEQRRRAEQHLEELEEVVSFNVGMFELADPGEARGNSVTVREVLDRAAERIPRELGDRPAVAARLMSTLGLVHQALGLYGPAGQLLEQALALRREAFGEDSLEVLRGVHQLAGARRDQRQLDEALELARLALEQSRELFGEAHRETAAALHGLAAVHFARGEWQEAEDHYREALEIRRRALGDAHAATAESANDLAEVLFYRERFPAAEELFLEALEIRRGSLGDDHPAVAETLNNLAAIALTRNDLPKAERLGIEVLELRRKLYGGPHRDLVKSVHNIGVAIGKQGRLEEAEDYFRQALEMAEQILRDDPVEVGRGLRALSHNLEGQGRLGEAEDLIRRALELELTALGELNPSVAMTRYSLARLLAKREQHRSAIDVLASQIQSQRQIPGMPPERLAYPLMLLAEQNALLGECGSARIALTEALQAYPDLQESSSLAGRHELVTSRCP
ncbi:MAG: serine/threonine-protein kinase [Acidobacteriota bacterium]